MTEPETGITGRTALFGILADPIAQVRSPIVFTAHLRSIGFDGVMVPMHVDAAGLADAVAGLRRMHNLRGFLLSVPHKQTIIPLLDDLTEAARLVGAVNIVRRDPDGKLTGTQGDGEGFVAGLLAAGHQVAGRRIFVAGAGGAARGVCFALAMHGAAAITIYNRTREKAEALAADIRAARPGCDARAGGDDPSGHDIAVNCTSLGMKPDDALPFDVARVVPPMIAAEVIMQPAETEFLRRAAAQGCVTQPGAPMLGEQVRLMAAFFGVG